MVIGGAILLSAYFLHLDQNQAIVWIVLYSLAQFTVAIFNFLVWAFITDVIDYQDVRTGQRDDATVYALYSWARKVGQALAGGLTGAALGWIGFSVEAAKAGQQQSEEVISGIYMLVNVVPGVCFILVGLVLFFLYPLKKAAIAKNVEILAARRAGTSLADDPLKLSVTPELTRDLSQQKAAHRIPAAFFVLHRQLRAGPPRHAMGPPRQCRVAS